MAKSISIKYHQCVLIFVTGAVCTDSAYLSHRIISVFIPEQEMKL